MGAEIIQPSSFPVVPWLIGVALALFPRAAASLEADSSHEDQRPLVIDRPPAEIVSLVARALEAQESWEVAELRPDLGQARFVHRSSLFRFPDDVLVRIEEHPSGRGVLHARSRSRHGFFDAGQNARNLRQLSAILCAHCAEKGVGCRPLTLSR